MSDSSATSAHAGQLDGGDAEQDALLRHPVGDHATEQRREQHADAPAVETTDSCAGPPPMRMTSHTMATTQTPEAKVENASASASLR